MEAHLDNSLKEGGNRRNGLTTKTIKSSAGAFELEAPRDLNGTFEPQLIKKRQTTLTDELNSKILALYGLGTSYGDISSHLQDIYGEKYRLRLFLRLLTNYSLKLLSGSIGHWNPFMQSSF